MTFSGGIRSISTSDAPRGRRLLWEGHRRRLRQRLRREGWDALKPHEMVEVILYRAVPRQDLSDVARLLVDRFGSVGGVFGAPRDALMDVPGMTERLAEWIGITGELVRAYCDLQGRRDIRLSCYSEAAAFLRAASAGDARLWALYADFEFNLITFTDLRESADWWEAANARRLLFDAVGVGARYVYLVRWLDRPAPPDPDDFARIEALAQTLRAADLELVDCLLVAGREVYSMNVHGKMDHAQGANSALALREGYDR